jgi:hypothetical protein
VKVECELKARGNCVDIQCCGVENSIDQSYEMNAEYMVVEE